MRSVGLRRLSSYVCGTSVAPLQYATVGQVLENTSLKHPCAEALIVSHQNIRWSYQELNSRVSDLASAFMNLGLVPGDRIGVWSPNNSEWTLVQYASARAGLILVNVNPAYRGPELVYSLNNVGVRALVVSERFKTSDYVSILQSVAPELSQGAPGVTGKVKCSSMPKLDLVFNIGPTKDLPGITNFAELCLPASTASHASLKELESTLSPEDPINVQFTSGTTGSPKGATLTHFNIINNGYFVGEAMNLEHTDKLCIPVPLYHCFGMVLGSLACVNHGASMIFPSEVFDPLSTLEAVSSEKCTGLHGVPTMFLAQLDHPRFKEFDTSHLRTGIMAGSTCPREVMRRVIETMGIKDITICYGMTETSPVSFQTTRDSSFEARVSTIGKIHPHVEAKVVDSTGKVVPIGERGELLTRGYLVMKGYWGDDKMTKDSIDSDGWMHTGDIATIDADGYAKIEGRIKDMVIRGGENIYPREVEELMLTLDCIQDVYVFGVPDEKFGEQLCAWVRLNPGYSHITDQDLKLQCKELISYFKIPHYMRFVDEFPLTATGKAIKYEMRNTMISELAAQH